MPAPRPRARQPGGGRRGRGGHDAQRPPARRLPAGPPEAQPAPRDDRGRDPRAGRSGDRAAPLLGLHAGHAQARHHARPPLARSARLLGRPGGLQPVDGGALRPRPRRSGSPPSWACRSSATATPTPSTPSATAGPTSRVPRPRTTGVPSSSGPTSGACVDWGVRPRGLHLQPPGPQAGSRRRPAGGAATSCGTTLPRDLGVPPDQLALQRAGARRSTSHDAGRAARPRRHRGGLPRGRGAAA